MPGITLKKLSELSGLSIRTVNRVLKDQGDVSDANRELVKSLARKYNYVFSDDTTIQHPSTKHISI